MHRIDVPMLINIMDQVFLSLIPINVIILLSAGPNQNAGKMMIGKEINACPVKWFAYL